MKRIILALALYFALYTPAFPQQYQSAKEAAAFENLVITLRKHPQWWEEKDNSIGKHIQSLAEQTGFNVLLHTTLVRFDPKDNRTTAVVIVEKQRIILTDSSAVEQIFVDLNEAIAAIYGVDKL